MSEPETPPIVVDPSPVISQVNTGLRDLALVASAVPTVTAVLGRRDAYGLINWLASQEAAPVVAIVVTAGIFVWRQIHARRTKAEKVTLARAAPDDVAIIKGDRP